jgi:hypothetical protein
MSTPDKTVESIDQLEKKLLSILSESTQALQSADKITFGNRYVDEMKQRCHVINHHIAEALTLIRKSRERN